MAKKTASGPYPTGKQDVPQQDQTPTTEERFVEFSSRYKWHFFAPILAAIVIVIVLAVVSAQHKRHVNASIEAWRTAHSVEDLDTLAREYPGTFSGDRALVKAGGLLFDQGKFDEARAKYTAYLETKPEPMLGILARAAIVQTYIGEQDYDAAIKACDDALASEGREYVETQITYWKGYAYEQSGDLEKAKEEYGKILPTTEAQAKAGGPWITLATERARTVSRALKAREKKPEIIVDTPTED